MSTTRKCHIIWQGYTKNFCNWDWKLHFFEKKDWEFHYQWERNTESIGYEKDVFNYFEKYSNRAWGQRFDELERELWSDFEDKYTKLLTKLLDNIQTQYYEFTPDDKQLLLDIMKFSLWKILFHKCWKTKWTNNTEDELNLLASITDGLISELSPFFKELLIDPRNWKIIYSQEAPFFIWDSIFHVRVNGGKYNNLMEFLNNPWSNLFFPLSKSIALEIEYPHPDANLPQEFLDKNVISLWKWAIIGNNHTTVWPNWLKSESMEWTALYRIPKNCDWYLCWPNKELIEKAISEYDNCSIYEKDPFIYVIDVVIESWFKKLLLSRQVLNLKQMILKIRANGVEWKTLGAVCDIKTWKTISKIDILENPWEYPVINSWKEPLGFVNFFNEDGNPIGITSRWAGVWSILWTEWKYFRWWLNYSATIKDKTMLLDRFLYFYLMNSWNEISNLCSFEWIPALNKTSLEKLTIPIPPLPVQEEIVKILDKFTSLEVELEAELEARKCQYEFYRNQLLAFKGGDVLYKPLSELWILIRWNGLQKSDFVSEGKPCIHYGQIYTHYGTTASRTISQIAPELFDKLKKAEKGDVIFTTTGENFDDIVKCIVWLWDESVAIWWHAAIFKPNNSILWKYFSYYTQTSDFYLQKKKYAKGIKVVDISMSDLEKIKIPLPPLEQQEAIVYILDHFDQLANDLTAGLPAELHLRQQQYAYYRDVLLNFSSELVSERERESIK